jgi:regulator of replication initiation timing
MTDEPRTLEQEISRMKNIIENLISQFVIMQTEIEELKKRVP